MIHIKKTLLLLGMISLLASCNDGLNEYDLNKPMGWASCASAAGDHYDLVGGGKGKTIMLKAAGDGDDLAISKAIMENDVVILDGSAGPFVINHTIHLEKISGKTIVGTNGAVLKSKFIIPDDFYQVLSKTSGLSTEDGTGGVLSNGEKVTEERELVQRQLLIDYTGDSKEMYRKSGVFDIWNSSDIIIRNFDFIGPGAMDLGGDSLMHLANCTHVWIDHCGFTDAIRTNMGVNYKCDFIDVTWCIFQYTDKCINHTFSTLLGGSDKEQYMGKLNVTFANVIWGKNIKARVPMSRNSNIHILNNLYECVGVAGINPRKDAKFLIEGCYFKTGVNPFSFYTAGDKSVPTAYMWKGCRFEDEYIPQDKDTVSMPYAYSPIPAERLPEILKSANGAGPTLKNPLKISR